MPPITELSRIEPVYLERLEKQGVFTTGILLEVSETPTRRQYLADHVGASLSEVLTWRDEALMLNLAAFGPTEHVLLVQAGIPGLESILRSDLETFEERVRRAARALKIDPPSDLTMTGWWEQARTLETLPETEETAAADAAGAILRLILGAIAGVGGGALAAVVTPTDPLLATIVVGIVMAISGAIGQRIAGGLTGLVGLVAGALVALGIGLARGLVIALPNTPFWQDQGIAVNLLAVGLLGAVVGWIVAWALGRPRRRPVVGRGSGRTA